FHRNTFPSGKRNTVTLKSGSFCKMERVFAANQVASPFNPFHFGHFNAKSGTIPGIRLQKVGKNGTLVPTRRLNSLPDPFKF
ncbi:MAG TPA: hypothetical protein PKD24_13170, partial [Pyrinomonadaceae bacterium]|nr:hypothetical protein [Pyrinomonadaceae bacterium]